MVNNEDVKKYYREVEEYDWVEAADELIGPETILHKMREREMKKIIKKFGREPFVDVGCGTGLILRHLPVGSIGLDLNPRNIAKAKIHAPKAQFILADIEQRLPLNDNSCNTVICTEVLEHLLYPEKTLEEIKRILKPGGLLLGSVPGKSWLWKLRKISFSRGHFTGEPYHKHRDRQEVIDLLSPHFQIISLYPKMLEMNWFFIAKKV